MVLCEGSVYLSFENLFNTKGLESIVLSDFISKLVVVAVSIEELAPRVTGLSNGIYLNNVKEIINRQCSCRNSRNINLVLEFAVIESCQD